MRIQHVADGADVTESEGVQSGTGQSADAGSGGRVQDGGVSVVGGGGVQDEAVAEGVGGCDEGNWTAGFGQGGDEGVELGMVGVGRGFETDFDALVFVVGLLGYDAGGQCVEVVEELGFRICRWRFPDDVGTGQIDFHEDSCTAVGLCGVNVPVAFDNIFRSTGHRHDKCFHPLIPHLIISVDLVHHAQILNQANGTIS